MLSRQRDGAENGLQLLSSELPAADFRTLLDTFNDRWVATARFLSTEVLTELLRLCGEWTATCYQNVDPEAPGESVEFFGVGRGETSPLWHAMAREYVERWIHHSQIRRALGRSSLYDRQFLVAGIEVVAAALRMEPVIPQAGMVTGPLARLSSAGQPRRPPCSPGPTRQSRCAGSSEVHRISQSGSPRRWDGRDPDGRADQAPHGGRLP